MAKVRVRLFATVREAAGVSELTVDVASLYSLFKLLRRDYGPPMEQALGPEGSEDERLVVLVNGRNVRGREGLGIRLSEEDEVALFPPVSGG